MKISRPLVLVLALAGACGSAKSTAPAAPAARSTSSIDAFHDVLAPLWHSPESGERTDRTCAAVPTLETRAQDVGDATLVETVQALAAECTGDRAAFKPKFAAVHDAFHAAMEKAGVGHDDGHEHPHPHGHKHE
jgi:hypothetical protein